MNQLKAPSAKEIVNAIESFTDVDFTGLGNAYADAYEGSTDLRSRDIRMANRARWSRKEVLHVILSSRIVGIQIGMHIMQARQQKVVN